MWNALPGWAFSYNSWWDHHAGGSAGGWVMYMALVNKSLTFLFRGKCSPQHSGQNRSVLSCAGHEVECGKGTKRSWPTISTLSQSSHSRRRSCSLGWMHVHTWGEGLWERNLVWSYSGHQKIQWDWVIWAIMERTPWALAWAWCKDSDFPPGPFESSWDSFQVLWDCRLPRLGWASGLFLIWFQVLRKYLKWSSTDICWRPTMFKISC